MTAPIGCAEAVRRLWEYLDAGLDDGDHAEVNAHLAWCLRCCGEVEFAHHLRDLLRRRSPTELPGDVHQRLEAVITDLGKLTGEGTTG